jgi:GTP-binding protein
MFKELRNVAIIAHVDHGKTTLIDSIFKQNGTFRENQEFSERVMDSNELEKERGITILAKCTAIIKGDIKINIVDTPGHADFGGEVERVLSMVDGVLLLVDSSEGPMPQTKFVLGKALKLGLKPMVIINKADRPDARCDEVLDEVFDLFVALDADSEQLEFPYLYASGKNGWCVTELEDEKVSLNPLLDKIIDHFSPPKVNENGPFKMLTTLLDSDPYLGRMLTGRIESGRATVNQSVKAINLDGEEMEKARLTKLLSFSGVTRVPVESAIAGDIISIAGLAKTNVANTICDVSVSDPIQALEIDPPTMSITLAVNDSPFAGLEGTKVTSTMIRDRLLKEAEINVAIKVEESDDKDAFSVSGRGELQLGVLIESMRREGFELSVSRPRVILKKDEEGKVLEPVEEAIIDVDDEHSGTVVELLNIRKGQMVDMKPMGTGRTRVIYHIASRGLIGFQGEFMGLTRGTGLFNRVFHEYQPYKGDLPARKAGALISNGQGEAVTYALINLQDRGLMFVTTGDKVYQGMIIGEHNRENDLEVNILKAKQLTNFRASGKDETVKLTPTKKLSLEQLMSYINEDELLEVTPQSLRLRKVHLDPNARKRVGRS